MTSTTSETSTSVMPQDLDERRRTLRQRIEKGKPLVGERVRITQVCSTEHLETQTGYPNGLPGATGTLRTIDEGDSSLTFHVTLDTPWRRDAVVWVHDVEDATSRPVVKPLYEAPPTGENDRTRMETTREARLAAVSTVEIGQAVTLVTGCSDAHAPYVGKVVVLRARDESDPWRTFRVGNPDGVTDLPIDTIWVHEVATIETDVPTDPKDAEIAHLRQQLQEQTRRANREEQRLEDFKVQVGQVAKRYAVDNGWCDTVKEACDEMDVPWPESRFSFQVTVTYNVTATRSNGDTNEPSESFIRDSLSIEDLSLDSDWDDVDVEHDQYNVVVSEIEAVTD